MRRLGPEDVRWLELETPTRPMHTLKVAVVAPEPGSGFAEMRAAIAARLERLPTMHWRLEFPPGGRGRPSWVEDEAFDLDRHLVRIKAERPGGRRELCDLVARAAEAPLLPRDRPLWEMRAIEGLADGRMALIVRVHHAFSDGVSFARILAGWFAPEPIAAPPAPGPRGSGLGHAARTIVAGSGEGARRIATFARTSRAAERLPAPEVPPSDFSGRPVGPGRAFGCQPLPLDEVNAARKPLGATINDLLIALVAGAVGDHLRDAGTLGSEPLVALVPVSRLAVDEQEPVGNRGLATMKVRLPTDVTDAVERVRAAQTAAAAAKEELAATAGARLEDALDLLPRAGVRAVGGLIDAGRIIPLGNLVLSNVRGPATTLEADGFLVEDWFSVGPCPPAIGLNITAWSYADRFNVSMLTDSKTIPDPWSILERLPPALEELEGAK